MGVRFGMAERNKFPKGNKYGVTSGGGPAPKSEGPTLPKQDFYWKPGWDMLCMAVIIQAAKDKAKYFFYSDYFNYFVTDRLNGPALWDQIQENYKKYGHWCQPNDLYDSMRDVRKEDF